MQGAPGGKPILLVERILNGRRAGRVVMLAVFSLEQVVYGNAGET